MSVPTEATQSATTQAADTQAAEQVRLKLGHAICDAVGLLLMIREWSSLKLAAGSDDPMMAGIHLTTKPAADRLTIALDDAENHRQQAPDRIR